MQSRLMAQMDAEDTYDEVYLERYRHYRDGGYTRDVADSMAKEDAENAVQGRNEAAVYY